MQKTAINDINCLSNGVIECAADRNWNGIAFARNARKHMLCMRSRYVLNGLFLNVEVTKLPDIQSALLLRNFKEREQEVIKFRLPQKHVAHSCIIMDHIYNSKSTWKFWFRMNKDEFWDKKWKNNCI